MCEHYFHAFYMIPTGMLEKEQQMMKKLKDLVDKQRDEIRAKDHELTCRNDDVEAVRIQNIYPNQIQHMLYTGT